MSGILGVSELDHTSVVGTDKCRCIKLMDRTKKALVSPDYEKRAIPILGDEIWSEMV